MDLDIISNALLDEIESHLADLSHEFKSPLAVILSTLQLLECKVKEAETSRYESEYAPLFEIATRNVYKTLRIASNIVETGRVAKGCVTPNFEAVELCGTLALLAESAQAYAKIYGGEVLLQIETPQPYTILCDKQMLDRILMNLLSNAIKHLPTGDGKIQLVLAVQDEETVITVRDNGSGISTEHLPYLFQKYWHNPKGENTRSGTGLGLYLANALTQLHGGRIAVQSAPEEGAQFSVHLPRRDTAPEQFSAVGLAYQSDAQQLQARVEFSCV